MKKTKIAVLLCALFFLGACSLNVSGKDGGILRSDDGGQSFSQKAAVEGNATISSTDVLSIAVNPQDGNEVYIGTKAAGIFKTTDAGEIWTRIKTGASTPLKVYAIVIDSQNPGIIWAAAQVGKRGKILKSEDAGETWKESYTEPSDSTLVLALGVDSKNPQNIFAGTQKGQILFSEDAGVTWRNLFWTERGDAVVKIAMDSMDPKTAYFVLFGGDVLKTSDGGKTFSKLMREKKSETSRGKNLPKAVSVATDPSRGGWVYIGTAEGLLRSSNAGDSWEVVKTLSKPKETNIRTIAINPANSDEILCGAAQAFYKSVDGGVNWLPVQSNSQRTLEIIAYNIQDPSIIYVGMNKR